MSTISGIFTLSLRVMHMFLSFGRSALQQQITLFLTVTLRPIFSQGRNCRNVSIIHKLRPAMATLMNYDIAEKLFSLSANGQTKELMGVTAMQGLNLNVANERGWTALMFAVRNGHIDTVQYLLGKGADPGQLNVIGQSALDIAAFWGHDSILTLLRNDQDNSHAQEIVHTFTTAILNRMSDKRTDAQWLSKAIQQENTRIIVFVEGSPLLMKTSQSLIVKLFKASDLVSYCKINTDNLVLLGVHLINGAPLFALEMEKGISECLIAEQNSETETLYVCEKIRDALGLPESDAALVGLAHSIFDWHRRYKFCESCGSITTVADAGYRRQCTNQVCLGKKGEMVIHTPSNTAYPRVDPSIIVAVISLDNQQLLLAQGHKYQQGMWSCVAGFMEPGESIEAACRREVFEETGVGVGKVIYHSSQPWPYPCQLMIGLTAMATTSEIFIDKKELKDARWFSRKDVLSMITRKHKQGFFVPPKQAIAHHLIKQFLHDSTKYNSSTHSKL